MYTSTDVVKSCLYIHDAIDRYRNHDSHHHYLCRAKAASGRVLADAEHRLGKASGASSRVKRARTRLCDTDDTFADAALLTPTSTRRVRRSVTGGLWMSGMYACILDNLRHGPKRQAQKKGAPTWLPLLVSDLGGQGVPPLVFRPLHLHLSSTTGHQVHSLYMLLDTAKCTRHGRCTIRSAMFV